MITRRILATSTGHTGILVYLHRSFIDKHTLHCARCLSNDDGDALVLHRILQGIDHF